MTIFEFQQGLVVYDPASALIHHINPAAAAILRQRTGDRYDANASDLWSRIDRLRIPRPDMEAVLCQLPEAEPANPDDASIASFPLDGLWQASPILVFQDDAVVFGPSRGRGG